jgi:hypothetical protein
MKKTKNNETKKPTQSKTSEAKPLDPLLMEDLEHLSKMESILSPYWSVRSAF